MKPENPFVDTLFKSGMPKASDYPWEVVSRSDTGATEQGQMKMEVREGFKTENAAKAFLPSRPGAVVERKAE